MSLLWVTPATAQPQLRVVGTLTIEASASLLHGASEVEARLLDDAGHAVPGVEIQIKPLNVDRPPLARDCHARATPLPANENGAYPARSNRSGALCVRFEGTPERAEFELSFSDAQGLYGSVARRIIADSATRNVEMAFSPAPSVLALERDTQLLSLATRPTTPATPGETVEKLSVSLNLRREGGAALQIAASAVEIGSTAEFRVPSRMLGPPGPIELNAQFLGSASTRAAQTLTHATTTAQAVLSLAEPIAASHPESGVRIRVRVDSVAGPVPSGSVEARSGGTSLVSARVAHGLAELYVQLEESQAKARPIELRYVADAPWWLPAPPLSVAIPILPPSPFRRVVWIAAVSLLACWLLLNWQRPTRVERSVAKQNRQHGARAPIDLVEAGDALLGWRGQVLDAHNGIPIANAVVQVRLPAFDSSGVLRSACSGIDGAFVLDGATAIGPGAVIEVRAPFHAPLAAPMPHPGTLILSLTSRRRTLLDRFVTWATHDGAGERRGEATPGEVAKRTDRGEVITWAHAVDEAVFGPDPLSEAKEREVVGREPPHHRKSAGKRDHA